MILLSAQGFSPTQIAGVLGYDPHTVRRWIGRWHTEGVSGLADRPRQAGLGWAAPGWASASKPCWPNRKPGPPLGSGGNWDGQRSACAP
jgi:transposase